MHRLSTVVGAAAVLALPFRASAEWKPGPIVVDAHAPWRHAEAQIDFPAAIGEFSRLEISENAKDQRDVSLAFQTPNGDSTLSIFVFKPAHPQAPIWIDRTQAVIHVGFAAGRLGGGKLSDSPLAVDFVPPGHTVRSGLRLTYAIEGGKAKATGVAIVPTNAWLVSMRLTSNTLNQAEVDSTLARAAEALGFAKEKRAQAPAQLLADCPTMLTQKPAKRAKADMAGALMAGLMGIDLPEKDEDHPSEPSATKTGPDEEDSAPEIFCRDAASTDSFGVYQPVGGLGGYTLVFGDAGPVIDVRPSIAAALLGGGKKVDVTLRLPERTLIYAPFKSSPTIEQVLAVVNGEAPVSVVDSKGNVTISSGLE